MQCEHKIVEFEKYCKTCYYEKVKQHEDPCHECLSEPTNLHSKKPINYKEKDKK